MTERYDLVVVGGGLLGCLTAWMAARDGAHVLLVDKDQVNQHASGQNAGSLHFQLEYRMVEAGEEAARVAAEAMPLHLDAAAMWARMEDEIGEPLGVRQTGGLMVAENADQVGMLEFKAELERSWGLDVRTLDRTELDAVAPYLSRNILAANLSALEGKADARIAAPAVGRAAVAA
ncbi:FAD-dependent oxidoreductase, partial [Streptomyces sp. NPDC002922]